MDRSVVTPPAQPLALLRGGTFTADLDEIERAVQSLQTPGSRGGKARLTALWDAILMVPPFEYRYTRTREDLRPGDLTRRLHRKLIDASSPQRDGVQWVALAMAVHVAAAQGTSPELRRQLEASNQEDGLRALGDRLMRDASPRDWQAAFERLWRPAPTAANRGRRQASEFKRGDHPTSEDLSSLVPAIQRVLLRQPLPPELEAGSPQLSSLDAKEFAQRVDQAYGLRQAARYHELGALLPRLIGSARALSEGHSPAWVVDQAQAEAHHVTAAFLKRCGHHDMAWVAVDRGSAAATRVGSIGWTAAGAYRLANMLLEVGELDEATELLSRTTDLVEPELRHGEASTWSIWGALLLKRSVVASRRRDAASTWLFLGEARAAARQLGVDRNDFRTAFGPTNVAIHEVSAAMELDSPDVALERARAIRLDQLPAGLLERRSRLAIEVARASFQRGDHYAALGALRDAERLAPEGTHIDSNVVQLVRDLRSTKRMGRLRELRQLAKRCGVD